MANRNGQFALPDNSNASKALASINLMPELTASDPNPAADIPIATFGWVLLYKSGTLPSCRPCRGAFDYTQSD